MTGKKLLIAEGGPTMQKVIRLVLANEGFDISTAKNGIEALELLKSNPPDICILDAGLKELGAFEVKEKASEFSITKNVQFILLTSAYEKIEDSKIIEAGFQGHLVKPFDPSELREVIAEVRARLPAAVAPPQKAPPAFSIPTPPPRVSQKVPVPIPELEIELVPPSDDGENRDGDIRDLTESTIRMSGLDDYQWNVQDPTLPPPPQSGDLGGMTFSLDDDLAAPVPDLLPDLPEENTQTIDIDTSDNFDTNHSRPADESRSIPSTEQIERIVRSQVEEILKSMTQKTLPALAEKIVREELKKLMDQSI